MTVLVALSTIVSQRSKATKNTWNIMKQLLDYLASHSEDTIPYRASDIVLNIHSNASYISEPNARSRACSHFFLGWMPVDGESIKLNGAFFTLCAILKFVVSSAAEAKLGALFLNCKEDKIFRLIIKELRHSGTVTTR